MFRELISKESAITPLTLSDNLKIKVSLILKRNSSYFYSMTRFHEYMNIANPFDKIN